MTIQDGVISRIADAAGDEVNVDVGALVRDMILFDRCLVQSIRLLEVPGLVRALGAWGLVDLLESGAVKMLAQSRDLRTDGTDRHS